VKNHDIAIIGGGIIGTTIAFELSKAKLRVVVLDRQQPGFEASWAAAGMLSPAPDSPRDLPLVPLAKESLRLYPKFVAALEDAAGAALVRRSADGGRVRCDVGYVRRGALQLFFAPHGVPERDALIASHRKLGLAAEPIALDEARRWEPRLSQQATAAAWLPDEGTVEPRRLMDAALASARRAGAEIRANCRVERLLCERGRCKGVLLADGEKIAVERIVVAAGSFCSEIVCGEIAGGELANREIRSDAIVGAEDDTLARHAPTRPVRGQMIALRPRGEGSHCGVGLHCVVRSGHGYLVPRRDGQVVAGSTLEEAGFEKRVTPQGLRSILGSALELVPALAEAELLETWSGLRPGTPDDLPIIGPTDIEGLFIATGHYRNGILLAPVTAKLIANLILHGYAGLNAGFAAGFDAGVFSPLRFSERAQATGAK
jgi:glycine oxidase